jgi:hypothetical protein
MVSLAEKMHFPSTRFWEHSQETALSTRWIELTIILKGKTKEGVQVNLTSFCNDSPLGILGNLSRS